MAIYRVDTILGASSGVPNDSSVITSHWQAGSTASAVDGAIRFQNFLNDIPTGETARVADYIGRQVSRAANAVQQKIYLLPATPGPTGSPVAERTFTLDDTDSGAWSFPSEVAVVLSIRADYTGVLEESGATRPRARRRGRMYIGPLNSNASGAVAGTYDVPRPSSSFMDVLANAADGSLAADESISGEVLVVWSPTDWVGRGVIEAWVDNAFDTQRRRGEEPSARVTVDMT